MMKELHTFTPLLRGRLHIAYPMISFMQHSKGEEFLFNYFLNLECHKCDSNLNLCYVSQLDQTKNSWIHYLNNYYCYLDFLKEKNKHLHEALKEEMICNHYIYLSLDDFYLPDKDSPPTHNIHINMIYGFDDTRRVYKTIGYNSAGKFVKMDVSYEAVEQGFSSPVVEVFRPDFDKKYQFNREDFLIQIKDFLNSENNLVSEETLALDEIDKNDYIYGVSVYKRVFEHIRSAAKVYDLGNLYILYESSMLNKLRIDYLSKKGFVVFDQYEINLCNKCYHNSLKAQNLMLKFMINNDNSILPKVLTLLQQHMEDNICLYTSMEKILK